MLPGYNIIEGSDTKGFYTASHCNSSGLGSGGTGAAIFQPISSRRIGAVLINPAWNSTNANCAGITLCAQVDAMFVSYDDDSYWSSRVAIMSGLAGINSGGINMGSRTGWFTNINLAGTSYWVGMSVDKVWTHIRLDARPVLRQLQRQNDKSRAVKPV
jgi:hypothetical protein